MMNETEHKGTMHYYIQRVGLITRLNGVEKFLKFDFKPKLFEMFPVWKHQGLVPMSVAVRDLDFYMVEDAAGVLRVVDEDTMNVKGADTYKQVWLFRLTYQLHGLIDTVSGPYYVKASMLDDLDVFDPEGNWVTKDHPEYERLHQVFKSMEIEVRYAPDILMQLDSVVE